MNNFTRTILTSILMVSFLGTAAASPASLQLFPQQSSTKLNSFTSYEVTVENTGPTADVYEMSTSQSQVQLAPTRLPEEGVLEPGQSAKVNVWYNPLQNQEAGDYIFTVTATSRATGKEYTTEGEVTVVKDHEVSLSLSESKTACLGEKANYEVNVTNDGIQKETFVLTTRYGKLSKGTVTLEPEETTEVTLTASSDSPVQKNFNVIAASTTSYAQEIKNVQFNAENCYSSKISVQPQSKKVPVKTEASFQVTVQNTGTKSDTFTLTSSKGELEDTELEVGSKSTGKTSLTYTPDKLGKTNIKVTADSGTTAGTTATVTGTNGMSSSVSFDSKNYNVCEKSQFDLEATVTNDGSAEESFKLKTNRGSLSNESIELEPNDSEEVEVDLNTSELKQGSNKLKLTSTASTFGKPVVSKTTTVTKENCYDVKMNVIPEVSSAGENQSVVYRVALENTGTKTNTYRVTADGPQWVSVRPSEVEIPAGEKGNAYMYAGIPFEKKGEVKLTAVAEGERVRASKTVQLLIGKEVKKAVESPDQGGGPSGGFALKAPNFDVGGGNIGRVGASLILALLITAAILYYEW